jgi:hypothetical protein
MPTVLVIKCYFFMVKRTGKVIFCYFIWWCFDYYDYRGNIVIYDEGKASVPIVLFGMNLTES